MSDSPFWEDCYRRAGAADTFRGGRPSEGIPDVADRLPAGARALLLACGEGRNALYLAERGLDVTAADISEAGVQKLRSLAKAKGLHVATQVRDMRDYPFDGEYDLITAIGGLHLIEREQWARLIPAIQSHTKPGGYNVLSVFTDEVPPPPDMVDLVIGPFRKGEVFGFYDGWRILLRKSVVFDDQHPGGIEHTHSVDKLVAQKSVV